MKKTGQMVHSGLADVDDWESEPDSEVAADHHRNSANTVVLAPDSGFALSPSKQPPALLADLGIHALSSGQQIGRETDLKKYPSYLPGRQSIAVANMTWPP